MSSPNAVARPAQKRIRKRYWFAAFSGNALLITIFLHIVFGVGAAYFIIEHFQKKHNNFIASGPPAQQNDVEHKVEMAKRNNVESAPPDLKRIVTTDVSAVVLPDQPEIPPPDDTPPTTLSGVDGVMGMGMGGGGGGGGGNGNGNPFGVDTSDQANLAGTFYDFKQNPEHRETKMDIKKEQELLKDFFEKGWDEEILRHDYLSSPKKIYANEIMIPFQPSSSGPTAFGLQNECKPGFWAIVYHVTFKPTRTGDFCLAGYGDDFLVVRINGEDVLDSGYYPPVTSLNRDKTYRHGPWVNDKDNKDSKTYGNAVVGRQFHLDADTDLTIDVLISDAYPAGGTGRCGYFLMLLEAGKEYTQKDSAGNLILPLFQINADSNVKRTGEYPPFTCNVEDALLGQ